MVAVEDNDPAQIIEIMRGQGVLAEVICYVAYMYVCAFMSGMFYTALVR